MGAPGKTIDRAARDGLGGAAATARAPARAASRTRSATLRARVARILEPADIHLDGARPWDPQIRDERLFERMLAQGSLGVGESYVEGWWDCERIDELVFRVLRNAVADRALSSPVDLLRVAKARLLNLQTRSGAALVAHRHYDLGNDLFRAMLDSRAIYSCGYWRDADTLEAAQEAKLELVARKLALEPGMRVLDVGCGWGGAARYLAERHGVEVLGVTNSREQAQFAADYCRGLPIAIELRDYREIDGTYDRAYSIGMFEHVGPRNYRTFFSVMRERLEPDGLFLLHTIGRLFSSLVGDAWVERYIFPNSVLPSAAQIASALEKLFVIEDWHSFGADYDKTLLAWHANFERAWPRLAPRYGAQFRRLWRYYLLLSAGTFRARHNQLWQIVLSPRGVVGGYAPLR